MTVADLFLELKANPSGHAFTVTPVSERPGAYLGIDSLGRPCLFVRADERPAEPPLRTTQVSLKLGQEYDLAIGDGAPIRERFHSLCCEASDRPGVETFLVLIDAFLASHEGSGLTADALSSFFRSLVRLFAVAPVQDLHGERQGLWGELFVMSRVRGFGFWAPFWHSEATRSFDFSTPGRRVEVKTTLGGPRIHHFSHRQVYALNGEEIVIASLLLREEDSGLALRHLINECRAALRETPFHLKLEKAVRRAGMADTSETGPSFDAAEAEMELGWFRSADVPHFRVPEPPGVSETRYRADLSTAPRLPRNEVEAWLDTWSETSVEVTPTQAGR